jgi:hypothetical protein
MTEVQKINADAKSAFDKGDYPLAFLTLWKVGVDGFVSYAQREDSKLRCKANQSGLKCNWFIHSQSAKFFWEEFILNEIVFNAIFNSESADQLLHNYFTKYKQHVLELEVRLAEKFPQLFIKAIRVNQVFLNAHSIEGIKSILIESKFQVHQGLWRKLFEVEISYWSDIENKLQAILPFNLNDILSHCIIWLETKRFNDNSKHSLHHLARVYSFFIELVLNTSPEKKKELSEEDLFSKQFLNVFGAINSKKSLNEGNAITKLLISISNWINFEEAVISPYSFDLNIEPVQVNELLYLCSTPEATYKWLINGVRYEVNQLIYNLKGNEIIDHLEEKNYTKIPGKKELDIQLNRDLAGSKWASILLLKDLACNSFQIGNKTIEVEKILNPLLTISFNKRSRYEYNLAIHSETSQNWSEAFIKVWQQAILTDIRQEPFFLMRKCEYKKLNIDATPHMKEDHTEDIVQLFSYEFIQNNKFNRFQQKYNIWQKPFMKIGDFLFCPIMFLGNNIWFYSFAQAALLQKFQRSETQEMENHLGELIRGKGWNVKVINDKEAGELVGDVDIFVEDNNTLLFIQLKRTYFRLNLKDAYFDEVNVDTKAAKQLNEAEKYLRQPNHIYEIKDKPTKWILSTSFENIGNIINECHKINYFEFLNALNNPEIKRLKDLIDDLESDRYLKTYVKFASEPEFPLELTMMIQEIVSPLENIKSSDYKQPLFSDDESKTEKYNSLFNNSIDLNYQGRIIEALELLEKCISINPNDGDVFGTMADILANLKVFDLSYITFNKALELLPNDPIISRNYSLALLEGRHFFDGLSLAIQLYEKFPLLGDLRLLFEKNFELCIKEGLLEPNQISQLKTKWDSLN